MWPRGRFAFLGKPKTALWSLSALHLSVPDTKQTPWWGLIEPNNWWLLCVSVNSLC